MTGQKTEHHTSTRTHQPRESTRRFAQRRRRTNPYRTRGRLDASSRQPRGSATSCIPRARQGTTAATWALRARKSAIPRAPGTGAPMPPPWTWHTWRRGPSGRSTTPTRQLHSNVGLAKISSRRRLLRGRRLWQRRGRNKPLPNQWRRQRRGLPRLPCLRRARRLSHPSDHDPETTPSSKASSRAWRLH